MSPFLTKTTRCRFSRSFLSACFCCLSLIAAAEPSPLFSLADSSRPLETSSIVLFESLARTVTLWMGTATTFSTVLVSTSALALMPGRRGTSLSRMRILTRKLVTSSCVFIPVTLAAEPISLTIASNLRAGKASIATLALSPTLTLMMSFSLMFTRTSMLVRSATRMTSAPP